MGVNAAGDKWNPQPTADPCSSPGGCVRPDAFHRCPRVKCAFHPDYHYPLPAGHAFPMEKFREARRQLQFTTPAVDFIEAPVATRAQLERVHVPDYLARLETGDLSEQELYRLGLPWRPELLERSAREVGGTMVATWAALRDGAGANLAGGTHHAFADRGEGYCVLNDVMVALRDVEAHLGRKRVVIIDTDAHQGNGTHALAAGDDHVFTFSIHGERNYPSSKVAGSLDVGLPREVSGASFLSALADALPVVMERGEPELVFWISGADVHANDRFGQMRLSWDDMAERDRMVIDTVLGAGVPLVCVYGGGYNRTPGYTARLHVATVHRVAQAWAARHGRAARLAAVPGGHLGPSAGLPCGKGSETLAPA